MGLDVAGYAGWRVTLSKERCPMRYYFAYILVLAFACSCNREDTRIRALSDEQLREYVEENPLKPITAKVKQELARRAAEQRASKDIVKSSTPVSIPDRPSAKNVVISDIGMTIIDPNSSTAYYDVGVKATLTNNNKHPVDTSVKFVMQSTDGYSIKEFMGDEQFINPGASVTVSETRMVKKDIYGKIASVIVKINLY